MEWGKEGGGVSEQFIRYGLNLSLCQIMRIADNKLDCVTTKTYRRMVRQITQLLV